ncbi:MAG: hypothetical protein M3O71_12730 [Bacteroidota bacterium]|nr:hypothetical protein [Bacteroidota bacterium]
MKRLSLCSILFICLLSLKTFAQSNQKKAALDPTSQSYSKSDKIWPYAILEFDKERDENLFVKNVKRSTLSVSEILDIENLIKKQVKAYNNKNPNQIIARPDKYYKQFIAVINSNGEKEVWVNCCCSVMPYWKTTIQRTFDGGTCYFHLKINLTKNIVYYFNVNGLA